ncbi:putative oxygenase [Nocardia jinanensis]|uniref:Oxygenase n=2 Tax=Nocardia jinanensis TaxID=382504 RepID=A0A917RZ66_9NOCA|nr:putative oxygenase [Nocardia jinanensis]
MGAVTPAARYTTLHFGGVPLELGKQADRYSGDWAVSQPRLTEVLRERALALGVSIRQPYELHDFVAGERVRSKVGTGIGSISIVSDYLVGCDGAQSAVARIGGFPFEGRPTTRCLLWADIVGVDIPERRFHRLPGGLAVAARRDAASTRIMVHARQQPLGEPGPPTPGELARAWRAVTGEDIGSAIVLRIGRFQNENRHVTEYRRGPVLLAGDAAHRHLPIGGSSLDQGLHDGICLGWKLAAQIAGWAPAGLLDTYHSERYVAGTTTAAAIDAQENLLLGGPEFDPIRRVIGDLARLPTVAHYLAGARTGSLDAGVVPDLRVTTAGGVTTSCTALLRDGRGLILDLHGDVEVRAAAAGRRTRMHYAVAVDPPKRSAAPAAVVVRPDGHVAWSGEDLDEMRRVIRKNFGDPDGHPAAVGHAFHEFHTEN